MGDAGPIGSPALERVLIIGGGLGGLSLAHGLKKASTPFRVFEADPTPDFRAQGYRIKINNDGAEALKSVLTDDLWQYFERTLSNSKVGETDFNAIDGSIIASRPGAGFRGPALERTADRTVLRNILADGLKGDISYGKELKSYTITEDGVVAEFKNGTTEEGALIVGADGVRSAVRKQYLPNHKPLATNGSCIYGKTPLSPELMERFPARAAKWMTLVMERTPVTQILDVDETPLTLLLEPIRFQKNEHRSKLPMDYIYWVLIARTAVFNRECKNLSHLNGAESAKLSLAMTEEWDPKFRALFELQDVMQSATLRVASARPNIAPWEASERVTLIGDAIHPMSPCGGVGAVTAIRDAALLAKCITEEGIAATSIGKYESQMRQYAAMGIQRSYFVGKRMFAQLPFEQCEVLEDHISTDTEPALSPPKSVTSRYTPPQPSLSPKTSSPSPFSPTTNVHNARHTMDLIAPSTIPQQTPSRLLCWTVCAYRRPGLSEEDYHKHMSEVHGPLVKDLMIKYNFVQWSMTHNTTETRELMKQLVGPQFNGTADYDCIVQCMFRDVKDFVAMKKDPRYIEEVMPDHERFADTTRSKMTVGWIEDHVRDGKVVDGEAGKMEVQTNGDAQMNGAVKSKGESRLNGELLTNGVH